jgi:hypothetical protein
MYFLRAFALLLFLAHAVFAQQPTPLLPDPKLTPGDTFEVTAQDVCVPGYAKKVRAVPAWLKRQAYAEYGITEYKTRDYEVDHLIPLSLGGSNSIRNLWPQSTKTSPWNSYVKDALERKLHKLVCAGQLDIKTAQRGLRLDRSVQEIRSCEPSRFNSPRNKGCSGNHGQRRLGKHPLWQILETSFTVLRKNKAGRVPVGVGSAGSRIFSGRWNRRINKICQETRN